MEFSDRNHLTESEMNDLLKTLEKENVELVMQEEIEPENPLEDYEKDESKIHLNLRLNLHLIM